MSEEENKDTIEVDLGGGVKTRMPKEDGLKYVADRDAKVKAFNDLQSQVAAREVAEKQAAENLKSEEEKRVAMEGAQKGQLDQLNEYHAGQLALRDQENLTLSIKSQLAGNKDIVSTAVPNLTTLLVSEFTKKDGMYVHAVSGKSLTDYLPEYLENNPHFKASAIPKKVGGEGDAIIPAGVETITIAEHNKNPKKYASQIEQRKMIIKG